LSYSVDKIRADFPLLQKEHAGKKISYLDNAATTQKPKVVIDCLNEFYSEQYATVHRGAYYLSEKATTRFENVRKTVQKFINANSPKEIIYTKGATEGINLIANTWARKNIQKGDQILVSAMEHHSNIVPWQLICEEKEAQLLVIPMNQKGELQIDAYKGLMNDRVKLVCVNQVSNALGSLNPVKEMAEIAHQNGSLILVDGAQSTPHMKIDVQDIDCDFFTFSSHKIYGPSSVGALYGKYELLEQMPPFLGGGDMIHEVSFEKSTYALPPARFEAGTPAIAEIIGMGAAIDYIDAIGIDLISAHEEEILKYANQQMASIEGINFIGTAGHKAGVISFTLDKAHPHDIATIVDGEGIQIRAGHHCAQPVMTFYNIPATARASLGIYTTKEDIDRLVSALNTVNEIF
jgi:cysteine desulfurase / selenocysteine lyase